MKNYLFIAIVLSLAFLPACNVDEWTKFSLFYAGNTSFSPDTLTGKWLEVETNTIEPDFTEDLDLHGAKDKQVEEARLERIELHMIEPVLEDFHFIDKVEVVLLAKGHDPKVLARDEKLYDKSKSSKIFIPLISDFDMEESLRAGKMKFLVRYTLHEPLTGDRHIKVNSKVRVDSRRFGL